MKQDYGELVEYLDKKFSEVATKKSVDQRFDKVDKRLDGVEDQMIGLNNRLTTVEEKIEGLPTKEDFLQLQNAVDAYAAKADTYFMEMAAMTNKLNRHEKWIAEIAEKMGIKLQ